VGKKKGTLLIMPRKKKGRERMELSYGGGSEASERTSISIYLAEHKHMKGGGGNLYISTCEWGSARGRAQTNPAPITSLQEKMKEKYTSTPQQGPRSRRLTDYELASSFLPFLKSDPTEKKGGGEGPFLLSKH